MSEFAQIGCFGSPFCFLKISETCSKCKFLELCEEEVEVRKNILFSTLGQKESTDLQKKLDKEYKKVKKLEELDGCKPHELKSKENPFKEDINNQIFTFITKVGYFKKKDIVENFSASFDKIQLSKKINILLKFLEDCGYVEREEGVYCLKY